VVFHSPPVVCWVSAFTNEKSVLDLKLSAMDVALCLKIYEHRDKVKFRVNFIQPNIVCNIRPLGDTVVI
jgi:hypothetical protein